MLLVKIILGILFLKDGVLSLAMIATLREGGHDKATTFIASIFTILEVLATAVEGYVLFMLL